MGGEYRLTENLRLAARFFGRRYYSQGYMTVDGGLGAEAVLISFAGRQQIWLSTKEAGVEFELIRSFR